MSVGYECICVCITMHCILYTGKRSCFINILLEIEFILVYFIYEFLECGVTIFSICILVQRRRDGTYSISEEKSSKLRPRDSQSRTITRWSTQLADRF